MPRTLLDIAKDLDTTTRAMIWHEVEHKKLTNKYEELGSELQKTVAAIIKQEREEAKSAEEAKKEAQ